MAAPSQSFYHIGLRYVALASKPALIWLLVVTGSSAAAVEIGSLILVASLIGMAMSNEAHLQLYAAHFSQSRQSDRALFRHLSEYLHALMTHIALIAMPAFFACMLFFPKVNPVLAIVLALAERIADELLRFRLYRKEWNTWIAFLIAKSAVPAAAALLAVLLIKDAVGYSYTGASLVFSFALFLGAGRSVLKAAKIAIGNLPDFKFVRSYLSLYFRVLSIRQVAAILGLNVVLLDRYVGMTVWTEKDVAYLLLAGQIINGIFFALEAKFLSEHRANFINQDINLSTFWRWNHYAYLLVLCIFGSGALFIAGTAIGLLPRVGPGLYISASLMIVSYSLFYISIPLNDYLYYRGQHRRLSVVHVAIFAIYAGLVVGIDALRSPPISLALLVLMLSLRLLVLAGMRRGFDRRAVQET